jgi:hypothetical protein
VCPLWVCFTLVCSNNTLPYPFTSHPSFFNIFQYTFFYPLCSHLVVCDITIALSFSFPLSLSLSSIEQLDCYTEVHRSTVHNNQPLETPRCLTTDEWIKKMWYIYTMEYYSATRNNDMGFEDKWM